MANDSKTGRLDFCRTRHTQDDADRKESTFRRLREWRLLFQCETVWLKKGRNEYEQS